MFSIVAPSLTLCMTNPQCKWKRKREMRLAVHQSGHSIVRYLSPSIDSERIVSIKNHKPEEVFDDSHIWNHVMKQRIMVGMGGYICEEIFFGYDDVSNEAYMDYQHVRKICLAIAEKSGCVAYSDIIDKKLAVVCECHENVYELLTKNMHIVVGLIPEIMQRETLSSDEVDNIIKRLELEDVFEA